MRKVVVTTQVVNSEVSDAHLCISLWYILCFRAVIWIQKHDEKRIAVMGPDNFLPHFGLVIQSLHECIVLIFPKIEHCVKLDILYFYLCNCVV